VDLTVAREPVRVPETSGLDQSHDIEPALGHALSISLPIAFIHVFGIVCGSEQKLVKVQRSPSG
jgi:hypothetical protein